MTSNGSSAPPLGGSEAFGSPLGAPSIGTPLGGIDSSDPPHKLLQAGEYPHTDSEFGFSEASNPRCHPTHENHVQERSAKDYVQENPTAVADKRRFAPFVCQANARKKGTICEYD
jgi:hypothetical protein